MGAFFSYSGIVTLFENAEVFYGPFVKHMCGKKLFTAQCIYLVNGQDRQGIKGRKKNCFPYFRIWKGEAESTVYSGLAKMFMALYGFKDLISSTADLVTRTPLPIKVLMSEAYMLPR